ncbi:tyrosine-type recombinase/integrase [Aquabacterium sp. OR-4]|uniref:tyrosine-type recombinase/integrase n=1 Tax=Aquabacterium sp. OR-4 TaxID=2978127 RepID=UPI0021B214B4|nr:integrase arm-type DNA-binding domain-containing protein [Aquabacterium sp. OR-4]MDT7836498.1 tyrosine-type recombinase/integrase [Aquabacterium sp. OR-4]
MQFDPRAARLLKAGDHMTVADAPGLRLVRSAAGWAWTYRFKSPTDGRMRQLKIGAWPAVSAAAAGGEWERLRALRDAGHDPAQERRQARHEQQAQVAAERDEARHGRYTVGRLLAEFHAAQQRAPKGMAELKRTLDKGAASIADRLPTEVTRSVAYDLIDAQRAAPVQARSLRRELGAAWDWAHDSGRLSEDVPNWWRLILRGKLPSAGKIVGGQHQGVVKRALSLEEVGTVVRFLPHTSRLVADLLTLYLWTGCRGGELVQIEAGEVAEEADGWWWTLPKAKQKMRRHELVTDLRVPLVGRAMEVVRTRMDVHTGHLFPSVSGEAAHVDQKVVGVGVYWHMPRCTIRKQQVRARWPVVDWAPHDLRRTVRTHLAAMGCPDAVAEAVLGHIPPGVAGVYNRHSYDAERREWITRLAARWESAAAR